MRLRFLFMVYITVLVGQPCLVESIFLPWSKSKNDSSDGFRIAKVLLELNKNIPGSPIGVNVTWMKNMTSNISVDERCFGENDMPLSFAFHKNHPYTSFQNAREHIDVKGMFPSLLSNILDYCCHGGAKKVKFAKLLRTPLEAEDRFLSESVNEYDFTFSIHAPSDAHSFRDYPFIPLVRAPSVVFLAYDGNERTSKTHAIATTIMKAWPIMVFILLTATFSGIIIWFLVSSGYYINITFTPLSQIAPSLILQTSRFRRSLHLSYPGFQRVFFSFDTDGSRPSCVSEARSTEGALSNRKHGLFHIGYF